MAERPPFVDVLEAFVHRSHRKPRQLSELTGLPLETVKNWLEGRVRRPRAWGDIVKLARALHLSEAETTALLQAAGHPAVAELAQQFPERGELLTAWPSAQPEATGDRPVPAFVPGAQHPPAVAPLPPGSRMPLRHSPLFVGRDRQLLRIGEVLCAGETSRQGAIAAVTGPGGIGKTQLAVEFVHRFAQFFAGGVFWISFADPDAVAGQVAGCGGAGGMDLGPHFAKLALDDQVRAVCAAWQQPVERLLVFDNCEDAVLLRTWLPVSGGCRVLLTSRKATWDAGLGVATLTLDVLERRDSRALLHRHRAELAAEDATLDAIAAELGDLPLALHLASTYLARYRRVITPAAYLGELQRAPLSPRARAAGPTVAHLEYVARSFALSVQRLDRCEPVDELAVTLLERAAFFAPGAPIPRAALVGCVPNPASSGSSRHTIEDALLRLSDVGLVTQEDDGAIRLHRLICAFVQAQVPDGRARADVEQTLAQLAVQVGDLVDVPYMLRLQTHLNYATDRALSEGSARAADLAHGLGYHLWLLAHYRRARYYLEQALERRSSSSSPEPLGIAGTYNLLGLAYQVQGHFSAARTMFEQALVIWKLHLAADDDVLIDDLHNLGYLHMLMGSHAVAESLLRQALYQRRKRYGLGSYRTVRSLNSIGLLRIYQHRYRSAVGYLRLALRRGEQALPEHHPIRAMTLLFLGRALCCQGQHEAALTYLRRSVCMWQELFGPEIAAIAEAYTLIARILDEQGDTAAAWSYLEQALEIDERVMGTYTRDTGFVLMQFGIVARRQGRLVEARSLLERAQRVWLQIHNPDHPDAVTTAAELAELQRAEAELERLDAALNVAGATTSKARGQMSKPLTHRPLTSGP